MTQISNREGIRLETAVSQTKQKRVRADDSAQRYETIGSNREKAACFYNVGEGVYLPRGLGLGVGRDFGGKRGAAGTPTAKPGGR
jgi:hypothetical protein